MPIELLPWFLLASGIYILWWVYDFRKHGEPVDIKCVENTNFKMMRSFRNPVFEVISGQHVCKQAKSRYGSLFGFLKTGRQLKGLFHPRSENIESLSSLSFASLFGAIIFLGSAAYLLFKYNGNQAPL